MSCFTLHDLLNIMNFTYFRTMKGRGQLMLDILNAGKEDPDQPAAMDDSRTLPSTSMEMLSTVKEPELL